jgi:hypothetical protein
MFCEAGFEIAGTPSPLPLLPRIKSLDKKSRQNPPFKGLIAKIVKNKELMPVISEHTKFWVG